MTEPTKRMLLPTTQEIQLWRAKVDAEAPILAYSKNPERDAEQRRLAQLELDRLNDLHEAATIARTSTTRQR